MSILIKNGRIVTSTDNFIGDVFIEDECIRLIGKNLKVTPSETVDANGKLIFPGGIDPHVHLDLPVMGTRSSDDFETGTKAALFGGTTTILDFANQQKGGTLHEALETWHNKAKNKSYCDYSFHVSVTDFNDSTKDEIRQLIKKEGITSFKTFMAYKDTLMVDDQTLKNVMLAVRELDGLVTVHATDGNMIEELVQEFRSEKKLDPLYHCLSQPDYTESEAVQRFIDLAIETGVKAYVVHMTCDVALQMILKANQKGGNILAETCPQYLFLDDNLYNKGEESVKWILSPPLRKKEDQQALWQGLTKGDIQTVGTDHCPFFLKDKLKNKEDFTKVPNGLPGIEHRMELLYSEGVLKDRISLNKFVEITSTNSAKIFGLYPRKGDIKVGSDADLVIFNPEAQHTISVATHHHRCDYSAFEGWDINGKIETVILRGEVVVEGSKLQASNGHGRFLKRALPML